MDSQPAAQGGGHPDGLEVPWFRKLSSPILFLIISLTLVGG